MGELSGDYLTTRGAADLLEVTKARVDQFVREGRLRVAATVGTTRLFLRSDVIAFGKLPRPQGKPKDKYKNVPRKPKKKT